MVGCSPARFLVLSGVLLGCAREEAEARPASGHASDVVLLVEGLPLTRAEVTQLCDDIRELYPEYSPLHARRLALTNEFLPRLAARALEPERWRQARDACERTTLAPESGSLDGAPAPLRMDGHFRALGLALWSAARHQPLGEWSPPLEITGRWVRVRLDGRSEDSDPLLETLQLSLLEFPYLDPREAHATVEGAIDRARLELVDPGFAEAVPEAWKHRMRATIP